MPCLDSGAKGKSRSGQTHNLLRGHLGLHGPRMLYTIQAFRPAFFGMLFDGIANFFSRRTAIGSNYKDQYD